MDKAPKQKGDRLITPAAAASHFGVDPKTVARWAELGLLTPRRTVGRQRRYWESEILALAVAQDVAVAS